MVYPVNGKVNPQPTAADATTPIYPVYAKASYSGSVLGGKAVSGTGAQTTNTVQNSINTLFPKDIISAILWAPVSGGGRLPVAISGGSYDVKVVNYGDMLTILAGDGATYDAFTAIGDGTDNIIQPKIFDPGTPQPIETPQASVPPTDEPTPTPTDEPTPSPAEEPTHATVILAASKLYNGHEPGTARFGFALSDSNGVLQTKTNNDSGAVQFDALTFNEEGTYSYTIREERGNVPVVIYDGSLYNAIVTVSLNGDGDAYVATLRYTTSNGGIPLFNNSSRPYIPGDDQPEYNQIGDDDVPGGVWVPDEDGEWIFIPDDDAPLSDGIPGDGTPGEIPQTGDTGPVIWALLCAVSLFAFGWLLIFKSKRTKKK
jgi:pilin isopeptide linkage protein